MSSLPFKVKAVYEYISHHDDDLHFSNGQIITVTEEENDDWYSGEYTDESGSLRHGIFPKNFVEKYEPTAPPRPTRTTRPKKETELAMDASNEPFTTPEHKLADDSTPVNDQSVATSNNDHLQPILNYPRASYTSQHEKAPQPTPDSMVASPEPSHSQNPEKPAEISFKARIAAFNKPASPVAPIAPFKPGRLSSSFIKKPFVAPPPSKNAYVPIPRDQLTPKIYRRDEDYDFVAKESENSQAEGTALTPTINTVDEEEPKPTSLKERIALLQKQQLEQASRLADAPHKKEKSKRPVIKHIDPNAQVDTAEEGYGVSLERTRADEVPGKVSVDSVRDDSSQDRKHIPATNDDYAEPESKDELYDKPRDRVSVQVSTTPPKHSDAGEEGPAVEAQLVENDSEDDEEVDPEIRRKEELRARMAKMSGGMGMHGIFGPPGSMPMPIMIAPPKKKENTFDKNIDDSKTEELHTPIPTVLTSSKSQESLRDEETVSEQNLDVEVADSFHDQASSQISTFDGGAHPLTGGRPVLSVPNDSFHPTAIISTSPGTGSESDDEHSSGAQDPALVNPTNHQYHRLHENESPTSLTSVHSKRELNLGTDPASPTSPTIPFTNKRASRPPPPPIPSGFASPQLQARAPPPPPPGMNNLFSTNEQRLNPAQIPPITASEESGEVTEYEGDYDTDITPTLPHKDTPKNHIRNESTEEYAPAPSPMLLPSSHPGPIPSSVTPRVHAPVPLQLKSDSRPPFDMPKSAPPPPPNRTWEHENEYDPYKYSAPKQRAPSVPSAAALSPKLDSAEIDLYSASPPRSPYILHERKPQLPPRDYTAPPVNRAPPRTSLEVSRPATVSRRSIDLSRISLDSGYLANDIDLAPKSFWWIQPNGTPPVLQGRKDILFESEETPISNNGKVMVRKELYVLFQDYSQTIVSSCFDPENPADITLEQRHEQPPSRLRQDQLEQAHEQLGRRLFDGVTARRETVVGDGTPQGLVTELLRPLSDALLPIGTRSYGALVYGNIANASTQQNDEIRPGDLITFRNAKFQGKHGPLNAKYNMEVGKPDHVAVVAEWDGTKKKIRAWEQGRESKKVKIESFKLDDLRSGEVKIWRIMPRSWVGWEGQN